MTAKVVQVRLDGVSVLHRSTKTALAAATPSTSTTVRGPRGVADWSRQRRDRWPRRASGTKKGVQRLGIRRSGTLACCFVRIAWPWHAAIQFWMPPMLAKPGYSFWMPPFVTEP